MILVLFTWRSPQKSTERKSRPREGVRLAWTRSSRSCGTKSCSPTLQGGRTKCQPDEMPTKSWHFVRTFFCGWHFVRPNFWLAFCLEHLNMFWPFVWIIIIRLVWWVLMTSHTCLFISDQDFSGKRRGVRTEVQGVSKNWVLPIWALAGWTDR